MLLKPALRLARDFSAVELAAKSKNKLKKNVCEVTIREIRK